MGDAGEREMRVVGAVGDKSGCDSTSRTPLLTKPSPVHVCVCPTINNSPPPSPDAAMRPLAPDSRPLLHLACDCARGTSDETVRLAAGQAMCLAFGCPAVTPRHLLAVDEVRIDRWGGVERVWEGIGNGENGGGGEGGCGWQCRCKCGIAYC